MKKTLISAVSAALVIGAASTTFAAANPFSDVPANSWAYNAVATLAKDGVVNGFPNGTFQGQKTMTRYEMAQIVAKAMAYENMTKADKAIVDKLAVEFGSELQNLGVRVSNLEKKSDNVKLTGSVEYEYDSTKNNGAKKHNSELKFKLTPEAFINKNVTAHAEIAYKLNPEKDSENVNDEGKAGTVEVSKVYVNTNLAGADLTVGRFGGYVGNGLVYDHELTGGQFVVGNKTQVTGFAGRMNDGANGTSAKDQTANLYGVQVNHAVSDKVGLAAGYTAVRGAEKVFDDNDYSKNTSAEAHSKANVWYAGLNAQVAKNVNLVGDYAKNGKADNFNKAYSVELDYKGADAAKAGSFGTFVAYRNLGEYAALQPTYDAIQQNQKGIEAGVQYVPAENIMTTVKYFNGKNLALAGQKETKANELYTKVEFLF